jgi:hypothetical protein
LFFRERYQKALAEAYLVLAKIDLHQSSLDTSDMVSAICSERTPAGMHGSMIILVVALQDKLLGSR